MNRFPRLAACLMIAAVVFTAVPFATAAAATALPEIIRLSGDTRIDTACAIAEACMATAVSDTPETSYTDVAEKVVVVANGYNYPDALSGAVLAAENNAFVLLTDGKSITVKTYEEIRKAAPDKIYILGGEMAVTADVEDSLRDICCVTRLAGLTRYETALAIANSLPEHGDVCFMVSGENYPDALSISPVAGKLKAPILFGNSCGSISDDILNYILGNGFHEAVIVGGPAAISEEADSTLRKSGLAVSRVYGADRYKTSAAVYDKYASLFDSSVVSVASGENYPDALTGSVYSTYESAPMLLTSEIGLNQDIESRLTARDVLKAIVYGGKAAVSDETIEYLLDKDPSTPPLAVPGTLIKAERDAAAYSLPDASLGRAFSVVKGNTYNVIQKSDVKNGTGTITWYKIQRGRSYVWVREQDMLCGSSTSRHITRTITVTASRTPLLASLDKNAKTLTNIPKGKVLTAADEGSNDSDVTYFKVNYNGKTGWITRKDVSVKNTFTVIKPRTFTKEHKAIIYLSPSCQYTNPYATGKVNEGKQMEAVAAEIKRILDNEYYCTTYIATPSVEIEDRTAEAQKYQADIYLAIHSNASGSVAKNYHGANAYYYSQCSQSVQLSRNIVKQLNAIAPKAAYPTKQLYDGMTSFWNIGYCEVFRPSNDGMVAVLAETEYHDNKTGSDWIQTHHKEIARAYIKALVDTFNIPRK